MKNRVLIIFWHCWDPLYTLKFQVFFTPCEQDMSKHILMIFPTLHAVRRDYALTRVCGRTITCLLCLQITVVLAFSLTNHNEHR